MTDTLTIPTEAHQGYIRGAAALLPTGTKLNPSAPEGAEYYAEDLVAYIVTNGKTHRVFTSAGYLHENWDIGTRHEVRHDQTRRLMGVFAVVGIVNFATGETVGEVPTRAIPHLVFK